MGKTMIKRLNGQYVEMTQEEIAELEQLYANQPAPEPTAEERLVAIEEQLAAAKILLGVE